MNYQLHMPGDDAGDSVRRFIAYWLNQRALRDIIEADGGQWPTNGLAEQASALHKYSARWDFRAGAERLELRASASSIDDRIVTAAAAELGLTVSRPPMEPRYDHAIVLGGTVLSSICRFRHLLELRDAGLEVGAVAVLTALRPISVRELDLARQRTDVPRHVSSAHTEFDVFVSAISEASGCRAEVSREAAKHPNLARACARVDDTVVIAAASADPGRRANTRDNFAAYSEQLRPGQSVLIVTNAIYLPYQILMAACALGWERPLTIEAVGFPPAWMGGVLTGPKNILQELRSAFHAAQSTLEQLGQTRST